MARRGGTPARRSGVRSYLCHTRRRDPPEVPLVTSVTTIGFHPEASAELAAAARYYEEAAPNLGLEFIAADEASCEHIGSFPNVGRPFGRRLRRFLVPRFPYAVIYRAEEGEVTVVAIANLYRRPGYWRNR